MALLKIEKCDTYCTVLVRQRERSKDYLVEPGTAPLGKVPVPVVVVHVEGGEGETVVTVHGVPGVAVVQVLVVEPEGVPLTA